MLSLNPRLVGLFAGVYAAGTVIGESMMKQHQHGKHTSRGIFTEESKGGEL